MGTGTADVEAVAGQRPLHVVRLSGHAETAKILLDYGDLNSLKDFDEVDELTWETQWDSRIKPHLPKC